LVGEVVLDAQEFGEDEVFVGLGLEDFGHLLLDILGFGLPSVLGVL
jgi:hypothetical protein